MVDRIDDFGGVIDRLIELGSEEDEDNTFTQIDFIELFGATTDQSPWRGSKIGMIPKLQLFMWKVPLLMDGVMTATRSAVMKLPAE